MGIATRIISSIKPLPEEEKLRIVKLWTTHLSGGPGDGRHTYIYKTGSYRMRAASNVDEMYKEIKRVAFRSCQHVEHEKTRCLCQ